MRKVRVKGVSVSIFQANSHLAAVWFCPISVSVSQRKTILAIVSLLFVLLWEAAQEGQKLPLSSEPPSKKILNSSFAIKRMLFLRSGMKM